MMPKLPGLSVALAGLMLVVSMLAIATPSTDATSPDPPNFCDDISLRVYDSHDKLVAFDHPSAKFGVPVGEKLKFVLSINQKWDGRRVDFGSPNQYLQLLAPPLQVNTLTDGGSWALNSPSTRTNVNFKTWWPEGDITGDNKVAFKAVIHPDNVADPAHPGKVLAKGQLLTIGGKVAGGRCGAKVEIYGTPGEKEKPCPGIVVNLVYSTDGGTTWKKLGEIDQGPNKQLTGPKVGDWILYTVSPSAGVANFTKVLHLTGRFNFQEMLSATGDTPSWSGNQVVFSAWDGQILTVKTKATKAQMDTLTFTSRNYTSEGRVGSVNNLCSAKVELRIAA